MAKRGRKLTLNESLINELCGYLSEGTSVKDACGMAGISESVFMQWQARGNAEQGRIESGESPDKNESIFVQFLQDTTRAKTDARRKAVHVVRRVMDMVDDNPDAALRAATWYMERSDPQEWGRQVRTVQHEGNVTVSWDGIIGRMSDALNESDDDDIDPIGG